MGGKDKAELVQMLQGVIKPEDLIFDQTSAGD